MVLRWLPGPDYMAFERRMGLTVETTAIGVPRIRERKIAADPGKCLSFACSFTGGSCQCDVPYGVRMSLRRLGPVVAGQSGQELGSRAGGRDARAADAVESYSSASPNADSGLGEAGGDALFRHGTWHAACGGNLHCPHPDQIQKPGGAYNGYSHFDCNVGRKSQGGEGDDADRPGDVRHAVRLRFAI